MQLAMGGLAAACVALGVGAVVVVPVLSAAGRSRGCAGLGGPTPASRSRCPAQRRRWCAQVRPPRAAGLVLASSVAVGCGLPARRRGPAAPRRTTPGAAAASARRPGWSTRRPRSRSRSGGLRGALPARPRISPIDFHPESRYFVQSIAYRSEVRPWLERLLYAPVASLASPAAGRVRLAPVGLAPPLPALHDPSRLVLLLLMSRGRLIAGRSPSRPDVSWRCSWPPGWWGSSAG